MVRFTQILVACTYDDLYQNLEPIFSKGCRIIIMRRITVHCFVLGIVAMVTVTVDQSSLADQTLLIIPLFQEGGKSHHLASETHMILTIQALRVNRCGLR